MRSFLRGHAAVMVALRTVQATHEFRSSGAVKAKIGWINIFRHVSRVVKTCDGLTFRPKAL
jgi:hypothetical protein